MANLYTFKMTATDLFEVSANSEDEALRKLLYDPLRYHVGTTEKDEVKLCEVFEGKGK